MNVFVAFAALRHLVTQRLRPRRCVDAFVGGLLKYQRACQSLVGRCMRICRSRLHFSPLWKFSVSPTEDWETVHRLFLNSDTGVDSDLRELMFHFAQQAPVSLPC